MQILALAGRPLGKQDCSGIFPAKKGSQSPFEGTTESIAARVSFSFQPSR